MSFTDDGREEKRNTTTVLKKAKILLTYHPIKLQRADHLRVMSRTPNFLLKQTLFQQ